RPNKRPPRRRPYCACHRRQPCCFDFNCEEVMRVCHSVNGIPGYDTGDPKTLLCLFSERRPRPRLTTRDEDAAIIVAIQNNPFSDAVAIREALHLDVCPPIVRYDRAHIYEVARSGRVTLNMLHQHGQSSASVFDGQQHLRLLSNPELVTNNVSSMQGRLQAVIDKEGGWIRLVSSGLPWPGLHWFGLLKSVLVYSGLFYSGLIYSGLVYCGLDCPQPLCHSGSRLHNNEYHSITPTTTMTHPNPTPLPPLKPALTLNHYQKPPNPQLPVPVPTLTPNHQQDPPQHYTTTRTRPSTTPPPGPAPTPNHHPERGKTYTTTRTRPTLHLHHSQPCQAHPYNTTRTRPNPTPLPPGLAPILHQHHHHHHHHPYQSPPQPYTTTRNHSNPTPPLPEPTPTLHHNQGLPQPYITTTTTTFTRTQPNHKPRPGLASTP
ncbi:hypothetical protein Hamer_G007101, partial [Homarus americanus]